MSGSSVFSNLPSRFDPFIIKAESAINPLTHVLIEAPDNAFLIQLMLRSYRWLAFENHCLWTEDFDRSVFPHKARGYSGYYELTPTVRVRKTSIILQPGLYLDQREVTCGHSSVIATNFSSFDSEKRNRIHVQRVNQFDYIHASSKEDTETLSMMLAMLLA